MLGAFGPEILEKSKRGLENLEMVTKASKKTVYDAEKGCPTYFTLLCSVLELLILRLSTAGQTAISMVCCASCHGCSHGRT
jgi:hypothetical protein